MSTGKRLRTLRRTRRLTLEELTELLRDANPSIFGKWDYTYLRRLEHDRRALKLDEAQYFAHILNCSLDDLIDPIDM